MPVKTPVMPGAGFDELMYRGPAVAQLAILRQQLAIKGLRCGVRGPIELAPGVTCRCVIDYKWEAVYVTVPPQPEQLVYCRGFLTHARNGIVRGFLFPGTDSARTPTYGLAHTGIGYTLTDSGLVDDGDPIGAQEGNPFPVIDDDNKTFRFSEKKESPDTWQVAGPVSCNYGNVDWKGPVNPDNPDNRKILTYRGNPSRYWPVGRFTMIPGLSKIDHTIESSEGDYSYTTVFSEYVYEHGTIKAVMPPLYAPMNSGIQRAQVLGAAYRQSDGKLICVVKTCYNTYPRAKSVGEMVNTWQVRTASGILYRNWMEDRTGAEAQVTQLGGGYQLFEEVDPGRGYFIEVLIKQPGDVVEGWKRLLRIPVGANMPNCNFFFSQDGTKACSVMFDTLHLIQIDDMTATYTTESVGGFTNTIGTQKSHTQTVKDGTPVVPGGFVLTGLTSGEWKIKNDTTVTYTANKAGELVIAADYKVNELVKMTAAMSGRDEYTYTKTDGSKWGQLAILNDLYLEHEHRVPILSLNSHPYDRYGNVVGDLCVSAVNVCQPVYTSSAGVRIDGSNCWDFTGMSLYAGPCEGPARTLKVTVTVTDKVSGLSDSATNTYQGAVAPVGGIWKPVASYYGPNPSGCFGFINTFFLSITDNGDYRCSSAWEPGPPNTTCLSYRGGAIYRARGCNWEVANLPNSNMCGIRQASESGHNYFWQYYVDYEYWCSGTVKGY